MKAFEAIENCVISYRDLDNKGNEFVLYPGDVFFIEEAGWMSLDNNTYSVVTKLVKIYYNRLVDMNTGRHEWTWVNDINIINPTLNKKWIIDINTFKNTDILKDVSVEWNREDKLKIIGA